MIGRSTRTVWLIDDDADVRGALFDFLLAEGFDPVAFEDASAAWSALEAPATELPSAIIVDRDMPRMDGVEFRRRQLAELDGRVADIPLIMFTGDGPEPLPGALVVSKSAGVDVLVAVLRRACAITDPLQEE